MAGIKGLVILAFSASIALTLLILGCALPEYNNFWPLFVLFFYLLAPLPYIISRRYQDDMGGSSVCQEVAIFLTTGIIISAFGLPVVLARAPRDNPTIQLGAMALVMSGNVVAFLTILGYFIVFGEDDLGYSMW